MAEFAQIKQDTLQALRAASALADQRGPKEFAEVLEAARRHLTTDKLYVVVCGEFKRGKSTFINALLDEPDLLPVHVDIATNVAATIAYGQQEQVGVYFGPLGAQEQSDVVTRVERISRAQIASYASEQGNRNNSKRARLLGIQLPNPRLRDGLVIVDTPGIGGLNAEHTAMTAAILPSADAVIFVLDAMTPVTDDELQFIRRIVPQCPRILFVVTKTDLTSRSDATVASTRQALAQFLRVPGESLTIVAVSSKLKLEYLRSRDPEDLEDSGFAALEQVLWSHLTERRGVILLARALSDLRRSLVALRAPIVGEIEMLRRSGTGDRDQLERTATHVRDHFQTLLGRGSGWSSDLTNGLARIRTNVLAEFQGGYTSLRRRATTYLNEPHQGRKPDYVFNLVAGDIHELINRTRSDLQAWASDLHDEIETSAGLDLRDYTVPRLAIDTEIFRSRLTSTTSTTWQDLKEIGLSGTLQSGLGEMFGGLIGGAAGTALGLFAGGIGAVAGMALGAQLGATIGSIAGIVDGYRARSHFERARLQQLLTTFLDEAHQDCVTAIDRELRNLERSIHSEYRQHIQLARRACDVSLTAMQSGRALTPGRASTREAELRAQLQQLERLEVQAERLAAATVASVAGAVGQASIRRSGASMAALGSATTGRNLS